MTMLPTILTQGAITDKVGSSTDLAIALGTSSTDADRVGFYSDIDGESKALGIVVGGIAGFVIATSTTDVNLTVPGDVNSKSLSMVSVAANPGGSTTIWSNSLDSNKLYYGAALLGSPAGSDEQIQFNSGGSAFGASANLTWDGNNLNIKAGKGLVLYDSLVSSVGIYCLTGGSAVYINGALSVENNISCSDWLQINGYLELESIADPGIAGSVWYDGSDLYFTDGGGTDWKLNIPAASPGGSDTQVQFNDGGSTFGGTAGFTWNKTSSILAAGKRVTVAAGTLTGTSPSLEITQTWNNVAQSFTAALVNVTDTTSTADSKLLDLQVGSVTKANITKNGVLTIASSLSVLTSIARTGPIGFYSEPTTNSLAMGSAISWTASGSQRADMIGYDLAIGLNSGGSTLMVGTGITCTAGASNTVWLGKGLSASSSTVANGLFIGSASIGFNADNATLIGIGFGVTASCASAVLIGRSASVGAQGAVGIGREVTVTGTNCVAVGLRTFTSGASGVAIGGGSSSTVAASAFGTNGIAIGGGGTTGARASANNAIAIGGANSGNGASATGADSMAFGRSTTATQADAIAIGRGAAATIAGNIVLGAAATHTQVNIPITTAAAGNAKTTGALVVAGGIGVSGGASFGTSVTISDLSTAYAAGATLHIRRNTNAGFRADTFSDTATAQPGVQFFRARGTDTLPTAVQNSDYLGYVGAHGHGATGFSSTSRAHVGFHANENWTDAAHGTAVDIWVTPNGTIVPVQAIRVLNTGTTVTGAVIVTGATVTASTPVFSATQTWNNAGTTFTGILLNVTNTASAANSLLLDLEVGGSTVFSVDKDGDALVTGKLTVNGLIDPTGMAFTAVAANPGGGLATTTLWVNSGDSNKLYFGASAVGGSGGTPGGADTQVQYNDSGAFGGDATFAFNDSTKVLSFRYGQLDASASAPAYAEGRMYWDTADHCLAVMTEVSGTTLQVGQENWARVTNKTGGPLSDGQVVYINGAQGNRPTVALADADLATADSVIGVLTQDINDNATGYVTCGGIVRGINTSSWTAGDKLYLSQTLGTITNVAPTKPVHRVLIGYALNSTVGGSIFVHPDVGADLGSLHDVSIAGLANNNLLVYNGTSQVWENKTMASVGIVTGAAGSNTQVQFNDGGTAFGADAGFTYNKTTDTLSVPAVITIANGYFNAALSWASTSASPKAGLILDCSYFTASDAPILYGAQISSAYSCTTQGSAKPFCGLYVSSIGDVIGGYADGVSGIRVETVSVGSLNSLTNNYGIYVHADHKYTEATCYGLLINQELGFTVGASGEKEAYAVSGQTSLTAGENSTSGLKIAALHGVISGNIPGTASPYSYAALWLNFNALQQSGTGGIVIRADLNGGAVVDKLIRFYDTNTSSELFSIDGDGDVNAFGTVKTTASTTSASGLRLPHGTAPSSPSNGDMWTTTAGLYVYINGTTVGPLSGTTTAAGSNTQVQFNDGGTSFGGDAGFTYNKTTDVATLVGGLAVTQGTITADKQCLNITSTWNSGGTSFTSIKANITDTASASTSYFLDLQISSTSKAWIDKVGNIFAAGYLRTDDALYFGEAATNGTWRFTKSGNNLVAERRESGSYVTKYTFSA